MQYSGYIKLLIFVLAPAFVLPAVVMAQTQAVVVKTINLTAVTGNNCQLNGITVSYTVYLGGNATGLPLLFDKLEPFLGRSTDTVNQLKVKDRNGEIPYTITGDTTWHTHTMQVWQGNRAAIGPVQVSYTVHAAVPFPARRGPHIDLQQAGGGLSGALNSILLLPMLADTVNIQLNWQPACNYTVISSAGAGNNRFKGTLDDLSSCQFLLGPLAAYPQGARNSGFSMYALGRGADEIAQAAKWPETAYTRLREKLLGSASKPFRVLIRTYDGGPLQSGVAVKDCFTIYLPPGMQANTTGIHSLLAHEMVHAFVEGLFSPEEGLGDWYNEGIADYLSVKIPYEAGLFTEAEFMQLVNEEAALYYTNSYRETPEKGVPAIKWSGRNAWSLGYSRGALYFTNLDAKLRRMGGKTSVIQLVNSITALNRTGVIAKDTDWVNLLRKDAGDWAVQDWQNMINGQLIVPEPGCYANLTPQKITTGLFNMGFSKPLSIRAGLRIEGLDSTSNAARAGLQEGDVIAKTIAINDTYSSYTNTLTITVNRQGKLVPIIFSPRKGQVVAYTWQKK